MKKRYSPCLYYHIGRCCGPCAGLVGEEEYGAYIDKVRSFLKGRDEALINQVREEMEGAAKELKFELASEKRDLLRALESVLQVQQVEDFSVESRDYSCPCEMRIPRYRLNHARTKRGD